MLCGISSPFGELFPIEGQITHVLRTRAPCAISVLLRKRALDLHVLSTPPAFALSQDTNQIIVARFTQTVCARRGQTVRTDYGTSYRLSKSDKPPCPAERRCEQLKEYTVGPTGCQPGILGFPQLSSGGLRTP